MGRKEKLDRSNSKSVNDSKNPQNVSEPLSNDNIEPENTTVNQSTMEESQSFSKSTNVKKVPPPPVESTINQRPRRKIKHKFIKCNRDSPEKTVNIESEAVATVAEPEQITEASCSTSIKTKTKNQQKTSTEKSIRRSGRQNRCRDSVSGDIEDSNLQMVEIIDDPSDDPNLSIEEIIETCVLDGEEYDRMISCSQQVCNDSSSNTVTSVADQSDASIISVEKTNLNSQNSCEKQISVGLVDCMKNMDIFRQLTSDRERVNDVKDNTFEGVFNKSTDSLEVKEKIDIKPTTEFCSPIRTRRVTRLSSMSARRHDVKFSTVKQSNSKNNVEGALQSEVSKVSDSQIDVENKKSEDATVLDDTLSQSSSDTSMNKLEVEQEIVLSSSEIQVDEDKNEEMPIEIVREPSKPVEISPPASPPAYPPASQEPMEDDKTNLSTTAESISNKELSRNEMQPDGTCDSEVLTQKSDTSITELITTPHECENNDILINDGKPKEKTKSKKDRKRTSDKRSLQDGKQSSAEEKSHSSQNESLIVSDNKSMDQSKSDFIHSMEEKFQGLDSTKQIQQAIVSESEESVKVEKSKRKKESHSDKSSSSKDHKSKRTSDSSKKLDKSFDAHSSKDKHGKSESRSSSKSSSSDKKSKDPKDSKMIELKSKPHPFEQDLQMKKSHKRDSSSNRSEKEIAMEQLKAIEQKTANRNKPSHSHKESTEKNRDSSVKSKIKSAADITKVKSKPKETVPHDQKDDKLNNSKTVVDQGSANRKSQQQTTSANRSGNKSSRCGTDFILSECYLPKQVKYDETLYSIEALKAAQAAQEEQMKADAEAARKAKEILAAKEQQAKAARAAARLAKIEEEKAAEKAKAAEIRRLQEEAEAEKAAKLAKAAAKAARSKQLKENSNKTIESPRIDNFGLFSAKDDSQEPQISSPSIVKPREILTQDFIPENFKTSPAFVQYQSLGELQTEHQIKSEETVVQADEEETNIRRSGRIKSITQTKQRAVGFGLVKDKDRFHNMYVGDLSYSSMSDSQYMSDYNSSNSNSMLDLSEIEKDSEMEAVVVKKEKTEEELEQERRDVAEGLSFFKQIIDCEYRSERTISKETKKMTCDCFLTKSEMERGELGCGEDCLNRLIFIECGSRCAVADRCTNRRFQKHQNSDCTIFKAGKKGFGLKAVSFIEAGEFIMEYVGEVLNSKQFDDRRFKYSNDNIQHHYFMALRSDCVIDATIKGNISRFINHSCDPNAETQKWTVNGELRIGFFSTRTIQPDEEITFDYQFQRYGKEAQKCYCEAENCRGWIGEEPDSDEGDEEEDEEEDDEELEEEEEEEEEVEEKQITPMITEPTKPETVDNNLIEPPIVAQTKTDDPVKVNEKSIVTSTTPSPTKKIRKAKPKPKPDQKPKKFKIKKSEIMEDPDLDHEIANLMQSNLKNQTHTLRFSRLMVRAKMLKGKSNLLNILRNGELACRRLFLDYHGLKLLHTWMCDPTNNIQQEWAFRLDILETLEVLPIPNKNMLQDSKVLITVQKWANSKSMKENIKSPQESPSDSGSGTPISEGNSPKVEDGKNVDSSKVEIIQQTKLSDNVAIDSSKKDINSSKELTESPTENVDLSKEPISSPKETVSSPKETISSPKETISSPKEDIDSPKEAIDSPKESIRSPKEPNSSTNETIHPPKEPISSPKESVDSPKEANDSSKEPIELTKEVIESNEVTDRANAVKEQTQSKSGEECADEELMEQIRFIASKLLESWEHLKEVFRIPKKLRIEQMKEHEQEANRSDRAFGIADTTDSSKRHSDPFKDKERFKYNKINPKDLSDPDTIILKAQRRRLFEAQMAQMESVEKRNTERQLEAIHIAKCKYFQLDPRMTSYRDIPFSVSPLTGQWYSQDNRMIATPPSHAHIKPPQELPTNPEEYDIPPMDLPDQWKFAIDTKGRLFYYHVKIRIPQWDPPIKILPLREEQTQHIDDIKTELSDDNEFDGKDESLCNQNINELDSEKEDDSDLESSDAVDSSEDELMQKRQQLLNSFQSNQTDLDISANLAVEISAMATTSDKGAIDDSTDQSFNLDHSLIHSSNKKKNRDGLATERLISPRTDEERLQSKIEMQRYKANKEKLRRRRENAKLRQHSSSEPSRKLKKLTEGLPVVSQQEDENEETDDEDEANVSDLDVGVLNAKFVDELDGIKADKMSNRPELQKVRLETIRSNRKVPKRKRSEPEPVPHNSNEAAKRIKEKFCAEMSGVIVQHLGPYRKDDCRIGRITNNDDFKHLARKLTHFVMLKELKHCDNTVTVLEVTDSVRAKSKEFIRKYMAKFGDVYVKPDNEPEYKEFCTT